MFRFCVIKLNCFECSFFWQNWSKLKKRERYSKNLFWTTYRTQFSCFFKQIFYFNGQIILALCFFIYQVIQELLNNHKTKKIKTRKQIPENIKSYLSNYSNKNYFRIREVWKLLHSKERSAQYKFHSLLRSLTFITHLPLFQYLDLV